MPSGNLREALKLRDLATPSGMQRLSDAVNASPDEAQAISKLVEKYLSQDETLGNIPVGKTEGGAYYDIKNRRIALSSGAPDVFSHEVEHAVRLSGASKAYKALLAMSKKFTAFNNVAAGPAAAAISMLVKDRALEQNLMRGAAALGAASAVPNLLEEAVASGRAYSKSDNKYRTIKKLLPAFGSHALHDLAAPGLFLGLSNVGK